MNIHAMTKSFIDSQFFQFDNFHSNFREMVARVPLNILSQVFNLNRINHCCVCY